MATEKPKKKLQERLEEKLKAQGVRSDFSVELHADKRDDSETYLFMGEQTEIESQISLFMAIRQLFQNSQGSLILGYPYEEFLFRNPAPLIIQIHWRLRPQPPWEPNDLIETLKLNRTAPPRPHITMLVKKEAVIWQNIKNAAGGASGRSWGPHYAVAHLKQSIDGGDMFVKVPSLKLYSGTEASAKSDLKKLLTLAPPAAYTMTAGEELQNEGARAADPGFRKPVIQVYPAWFTIMNYRLVDRARRAPNRDRSTMLGKLMRKWGQIPLWHNTPPQGVEEAIRELVKRGDDD